MPLSKHPRSAAGRATLALAQRLAESSPEATLDESARTETLSQNLLATLSPRQRELAAEQLDQGDGGELKPRTNKHGVTHRPGAHSAFSSAALAINAFGVWLDQPGALELAGVRGFDDVRVEGKLPIGNGGGTPNLDVLASSATTIVGVESKLTEYLPRHRPVDWRPPYEQDVTKDLLTDGWRAVLEDSLAGRWQPSHLHVEQLIKHALGLQANRGDRDAHLVYVWWEPRNADDVDAVRAHRGEVRELQRRVGEARPNLTAITYAELWEGWADARTPSGIGAHVDALRNRYEIEI